MNENMYVTVKNDILKLISKVNLTFVLAFLIESPRLVLGFHAIRESPIFAIPLSVLIAYSASVSWEAYFQNRKRVLLLILNIFQLISAVITIAPVLYYCAMFLNLDVDLKQVIPPQYEWFILLWVTVLALSTFLPLIVLAAVSSYNKQEVGSDEQVDVEVCNFDLVKIQELQTALMETIRIEFNNRLNESVLALTQTFTEQFDNINKQLADKPQVVDVIEHKVVDVTEQTTDILSLFEKSNTLTLSELAKLTGLVYGKLLQRKPDGKIYGELAKLIKENKIVEVEKNKFQLVG